MKARLDVLVLIAASAVILVHNHPGGDPRPSEADIRKLLASGSRVANSA